MPRTNSLLAASLGLALSAATFVGPAVTAAHAASPGPSAATFIQTEVAPDIDAYWRQQSRAAGVRYVTPKLVLFDSVHPVFDACSDDAVEGHEYCPADG